VVNKEITYLGRLRDQSNADPEKTLLRIKALIDQYPYFQALHHLGWEISEKYFEDEAKAFLNSCAVQTKNKIHLIKSPNRDLRTSLNSDEQYTENNDVRPFVEWLHQINITYNKDLNENLLINKFLKKTPKIVINKSDQSDNNLTKKQNFDAKSLMTETLAEVYLNQKKFKKAISAYEILALKYPEKSSLFANQIKRIKKIQNKSK
jgi:hypothetical protein